jgi:tetratricopeptide (TPR) repeat protein
LFVPLLALLLLADSAQATKLLQQGLINLQQGNLSQAREALEESSQLDPENAYTWSSLAETYLRLKQPQLAANAASMAESKGQENPAIAHALAMYYSRISDFSRAAALEQQYAESPGADSKALSRAASLYLSAGAPDKALPLAEKANTRNNSTASENLLGKVLIAVGRQDEGMQHLASAWNSANQDPAISFDYAQALLQKQNFTKASDVLGTSIKSNGQNAQLILALGVSRYGQRRFEDAISAFLKTIDLDPSIPQPYLFIGRMLGQAGAALPQITEDYRRWMATAPTRPEPPLLFAKALITANADPAEAESLLRRSIQLDGNNWESHYELGVLLAKQRKYREAATELARSVELDPKQPMAHYHLARTYDRLGEPARAKAEREIHQQLISTQADAMGNRSPTLPADQVSQP